MHLPSTSIVRLLVAASFLGCIPTMAAAEIAFDALPPGTLDQAGPSWAVAWGDVDGDRLPDLWLGNHWLTPRLFENQPGLVLSDATVKHSLADNDEATPADFHGAAWIDFDGDGDQDLFELYSSRGTPASGNHLYENLAGTLVNRADAYGIQAPTGIGQAANWFSGTGGSELTLLINNNYAADPTNPTRVFQQHAGTFMDVSATVGFTIDEKTSFASASDWTGDGVQDLIVNNHNAPSYPAGVYDTRTLPYTDVGATVSIPATSVIDARWVDVDNDLQPDLVVAAGSKEASDVVWRDDSTLQSTLLASNAEHGFRIATVGNLSFLHFGRGPTHQLDSVHIGASGRHPETHAFTLDVADLDNHGLASHEPGVDLGLYIGFDPLTLEWTVLFSTAATNIVGLVVGIDAVVTDFETIGFEPHVPAVANQLLVRNGSQLVDSTVSAGLNIPASCRSVGAADFDNDRDIDLYFVCTLPAGNAGNLLFENDGSGQFTAVPDAGGAGGTMDGRGDAVALADIDRDGYIDMVVTNGYGRSLADIDGAYPLHDGPVEVFHNAGSGNNWIELALVGVESNRDAIGARIELTVDGHRQLRELSDGIHYRAQDDRVVHFGLGAYTQIDEIVIVWPGGSRQTLTDIAANQLLEITETPDIVENVIAFDDVSAASGVSTSIQTFGVSWGDADGDSRPDAYLSNHWLDSSLYIGADAGQFIESAAAYQLLDGPADEHGGAWADVDGDGDQDLAVLSGGGFGEVSLYYNESGTLVLSDNAATGLSYPYSGRTPAWLDANSDGLLDLLVTNASHRHPEFPSKIFLQTTPGNFVGGAEFVDAVSRVCLLPNPVETGNAPDIYFGNGPYYRMPGGAWSDVTDSVLPRGSFSSNDCAVGDVNADGLIDLYLINEGLLTQFLASDTTVKTAYRSTPDQLRGFDFESAGTLTIYFGLSVLSQRIYLGAGQINPGDEFGDYIVLDSNDPGLIGEPEIVMDSSTVKTWIWYEPELNLWHVRTGHTTRTRQVEFDIRADAPVDAATPVNLEIVEGGAVNSLLLADGLGNYTLDNTSGISILGQSHSGALADFDNDGDLDLYLVNRHRFNNLPNQLFANLGDGTFVEIDNAGGAAGPAVGSGQSVSVADYDLDGFVDLFVANGASDLRTPDYPGPHQLFRNRGNSNAWLQIDLTGTTSAATPVGALVRVSAGDKTQIRFHDGGIHAAAQHSSRLHFGLGVQTLVDEITIHWPSGIFQRLVDVAANQVLEIVEDTDADADLIADGSDNCLLVANPDQCDNDADDFGNLCDADLDNNGVVNSFDLGLMRSAFGAGAGNAADLDCNGVVNSFDVSLLRGLFGKRPGPSGLRAF